MRRANMGNGYDYQGQGQGGQSYQMVGEENEQLEHGLNQKVQALKHLSINIGHEVREQNNMLRGMDDDFDSSGNLLTATMGRLKALTKSGHWKLMLYLFLFALFVFFMCWVIIKFR